ncbi:MAG TPA: hypothetical protein VH063_04310 [Gaiellaceae bacterium]|nr:hypothetical protein [Gaiellaceae bacterium]
MSGDRQIGTVVAAGMLVLVLSAASFAATAKPDSHDRALAALLSAKVTTFKQFAGSPDQSLQKSLDSCALIKKNPKDAFAAIFALLPVILIDVVNEYGPELRALRNSLGAMDPDSPLFAQWLSAEGSDLSLILQFDNHGKKIDLCDAATVLLDKKTTAAELQRVLGIDPALLAKIFTSPVSARLEKLNPKMRTFLIAAGVSRKNAATLTSSD